VGDTSEKLIKLEMEQYESLPIRRITIGNDLIGFTAVDSGLKVTIKIFRNDPKDDPTPITELLINK
jgi:hypothetical protein